MSVKRQPENCRKFPAAALTVVSDPVFFPERPGPVDIRRVIFLDCIVFVRCENTEFLIRTGIFRFQLQEQFIFIADHPEDGFFFRRAAPLAFQQGNGCLVSPYGSIRERVHSFTAVFRNPVRVLMKQSGFPEKAGVDMIAPENDPLLFR